MGATSSYLSTSQSRYFSCLEAIQICVKHAGSRAEIAVTLDGSRGLSVTFADTGAGAHPGVLEVGLDLCVVPADVARADGHREWVMLCAGAQRGLDTVLGQLGRVDAVREVAENSR